MLLEKKIPARYFVQPIKVELCIIVILSIAINWATADIKHILPDMPLSVPAFLGTAISILLSFMLSQSYDRWWEARKAWGSIVNDSRSLVMQLQTLIAPGNEEAVKRIAYRQIAWCYTLGRSLRGQDPLEGTEVFMSEEDRIQAGRQGNKALAILQLNAGDLRDLKVAGHLNNYSHIHLDNTLVRLCDAMGRNERINGTVFPSTYRMLLHFIIYLFVVTLSLALKDVGVIYEIPLLVLISSCFFLLEKTAYQLKDPFRNRPSDTSVTAIARTIEINIRQMLGEKDVPAPIAAEEFYIL
jgi:putative membrane protein